MKIYLRCEPQLWFAWHPVWFYDVQSKGWVFVWGELIWRKRTSPKYPWVYSLAEK